MQKKIRLIKNKTESNLKLPFDFFENHFQKMNSKTIKLYLYILYICTLGDAEIDNSEIAKRLELKEKDIEAGYNELRKTGLITVNPETLEDELINPDTFYKNLQKKSNAELKKETADVFEFNDNFKNIFEYFERLFDKPLNQNDMLEIYDLLENQKIPFEVLVCAASYANGKNKKSINYVAKVAMNWNELGLTSYESCEKYISEEIFDMTVELSKDNLYFQIKKMFNLQRDLFDVEKEYVDNWYYNLKKNLDDIKKALDISVLNTGKVSFPYINKVLTSPSGVKESQKTTDKKGINNFSGREYNYDNILDALRKKQNG